MQASRMNVGVLGRAIGAQDTMSDNNEPRAPSTNDQDNDFQYPEGGQRGNIVLLGSFMALMGGLGLMNSIGIYQARISTAQLPDISDGQIGWIFGVYNFMAFFCGIQIGPIFDNFGPTWLMMAAFVLYVAFFVLLSFCQSYWQYFVVIGIVGGAATSIIFVVPVACLGQYFNKKRGSATGLAMSGGSLGGIMFPLLLDHLWDRIGFSWGTRAVGLITIVLVLSGCLLIRPNRACRRNTATNAKRSILPDFSILLIPSVVMLTAGVFFIEWGFFVGLEYIASYALSHGIDKEQAYQMVVYLNAGSFPGRWLPGIAADKFGRLNTMIATNVLCAIAMLAVWLPANGNLAATIIFAVVFGFASGSNISLVPVCVGELCTTQGYGRYYTTVYTVVSIG
jgi:MFS family permease